ncbi:MAG: hypothetical protein GY727_10725 [Gammaproteobacteria bacterium]|nr:hypothetical protein [Gammaproteobacteria bacterium]
MAFQMFWPCSVIAQSDDYLKALEKEVRELDDGTSATDQPDTPPPVVPVQEPAPPKVDKSGKPDFPREEFKQLVQMAYPGSFILLRRLSKEQQQLVFDEYVRTGNLARVRRLIFKLARDR